MVETGKKLAEFRKSREMLQSEIGDRVGLKNRQISHLETGRRELQFEMITKFLQCLQQKQKLDKREWQELLIAIFADILSTIQKSSDEDPFLNFSFERTENFNLSLKVNIPEYIMAIQLALFSDEEWENSLQKKREFISEALGKIPDAKIDALFNILSS